MQMMTLNNGIKIPSLGLGVFQTPPDVTTTAVQKALLFGYRHIDTAAAYFNECEVGEGIRRSGIDRDEVFIETKVWIQRSIKCPRLGAHRYPRVKNLSP